MGNLFSRRPQPYHRMEESMVELETMLNAYDNRLAVCERESITDRSKIYELEKAISYPWRNLEISATFHIPAYG